MNHCRPLKYCKMRIYKRKQIARMFLVMMCMVVIELFRI